MPRVRDHMELAAGPRAVQRIGAFGWADDVIATLNDDRWEMLDARDVREEIPVFLEEATVDEVVAFDARESFGELVLANSLDEIGVGDEAARASFPDAPCSGSNDANVAIVARESFVVGPDHVVALLDWNRGEILLPRLREDSARSVLVVPKNFLRPQKEDAAQHELGDAARMLLRIGQRQGAAPRAAEELPTVDSQVLADPLHVVN